MVSILHSLPIQAEKTVIFEAISTHRGMSRWWTRDCFEEPKKGFVNVFHLGELVVNKMKVVELTPDKKIAWECIECIDEWMGTAISFEIEERQGVNLIHFQHSGWQKATDFFAICNSGWPRYLSSLKNFCETGKGDPFDTELDTWQS